MAKQQMCRSFLLATALLALLLICPSTKADAQTGITRCSPRTLIPAFFSLQDRLAMEKPQNRTQTFIQSYVTPNNEFYADSSYFDDLDVITAYSLLNQVSIRDSATALFGDIPVTRPIWNNPPSIDRLVHMNAAFEAAFIHADRELSAALPAFRCKSTIIFGLSLGKFDSGGYRKGLSSYQLFGIDTISLIHAESDLIPFLEHELYHIYFDQVVGSSGINLGRAPMWFKMWSEGLATRVSQMLNPGLSDQAVLWLPNDLDTRMRSPEARRLAAQLFLRDLDQANADANARWFAVDISVHGLPSRAGYMLGYLFVKSIEGGKSIDDLTHMPLAEVHRQEREFLRDLARH